jgi:hypothetical protein
LHGHWPHERYGLHIHGDGDELGWYFSFFCCFCASHAVHGAYSADWCDRGERCELSDCGVLDGVCV